MNKIPLTLFALTLGIDIFAIAIIAVGQERESTGNWNRFAPKNWIQRDQAKLLTGESEVTNSVDALPLSANQPRPLTVIDRRTAQRNLVNSAANRLHEPQNQLQVSNGALYAVSENQSMRNDSYRNSPTNELNQIEQASYQQPPQSRLYRTPNHPAAEFPYTPQHGSGAFAGSPAPGMLDYELRNQPPLVDEQWQPDQHPIQRPVPHHGQHDQQIHRDSPALWQGGEPTLPSDFPREPFIDQPSVYPAGEHPIFNENYRSDSYYQGAEQGRGYLQSGSSFQGSELRQKQQTATEIAFQLQAENRRLQDTVTRIQAENQELQKQLSQQREQFERQEQEFQSSLNQIEQLQQRLERRDAELALAIKEKNDIEFRTNEQLKSIEQMLDSVLLNQLTDR